MRLYHIFSAIMIIGLVLVLFYGQAVSVADDFNVTVANSSDAAIVSSLDKLSVTTDKSHDFATRGPGGNDFTVPDDSSTMYGSMEKSGMGILTTTGTFLYTVPKEMIGSVGQFIGIDPRILGFLTAVIILVVASILVSAILKNRI